MPHPHQVSTPNPSYARQSSATKECVLSGPVRNAFPQPQTVGSQSHLYLFNGKHCWRACAILLCLSHAQGIIWLSSTWLSRQLTTISAKHRAISKGKKKKDWCLFVKPKAFQRFVFLRSVCHKPPASPPPRLLHDRCCVTETDLNCFSRDSSTKNQHETA